VLSVKEASLLHPLRRFDEHPWFEIIALRPGRNLQDALEMNFACSGPLEGQFHVVVTTNGKRHFFPLDGDVLKKRRGVITCNYSYLNDKSPFGADVEAYIELTDDEPKTTSTTVRIGGYSRGYSRYGRGGYWPSRYSTYTYKRTEANDPLFFKVSKSATRGKVPVVTYSREIRPDELRLYTARRKKNGPPPPPPEGSSLAVTHTPPVPGTPVLALFEGDWLPAEVISVQEGNMFVVHWAKFGHAKNALVPIIGVAVKKATQEKLLTAPESFSPKVVVPQGSLKPIPDGYVVPSSELNLLPGTPVQVYISSIPHSYTVTSDDGDTVQLVHDSLGSIKHSAVRSAVTISTVTAKDVVKPEMKEIYATRLKKILTARAKSTSRSVSISPSGKPPGYGSATRHYGIAIDIPSDHVAVTRETPLQVGTEVKAYWGRKFTNADVRELHADGSVVIHWEGWGSIYPVTRETLIISKNTLATMEKKVKKMPEDSDTKSAAKRFSISLKETGKRNIPVIKVIMEITGLDLPTAKEVADNVPIRIKDGLSENEAAEWRKKFEAAGANVDVKPSVRKPEAVEE